MPLQWKPYKDTESVFYNAYLKEGDTEIITLLKRDETTPRIGLKVKGKDGYEYSGKTVVKGDKTYNFIERKKIQTLGEDSPERIANDATNKEYSSEGAKKGHEQNIEMHKERMEVERELITTMKNLLDTLNELIEEYRGVIPRREP